MALAAPGDPLHPTSKNLANGTVGSPPLGAAPVAGAAPFDKEAASEGAYAPPTAKEDIPGVPSEAGVQHGRASMAYLPVAIVIGMATLALMFLTETMTVGLVGFSVATLVALVGAGRGVISVLRMANARGHRSSGFTVAVVAFGILGNGFMAFVGGLFALMSTSAFSRGRQLRRFGRVLLPPVRSGAAWTELPMNVPVPPELAGPLAAQWRENGRTEHASVAAFARLTLDLMALGAPPALIASANRDALDEIRHTELCFSLARALDGRSESPGAFPAATSARTLPPTRSLALAALAVDSLVDGALHEGVSARVIAKLAKRCEVPEIRAVLKEIAADEGRHATHGWDVVEWCLSEGGTAVAEALKGAVHALPHNMYSTLAPEAEDGGWERHGIHGRALEAAEAAATRADLVRRVERMVVAATGERAPDSNRMAA